MTDKDKERLAKLQPDFAALVVKLMDAVKARGHELMITQGLRTFDEQDALYAQGRTKPGPRVTNAEGGESHHNYGIAVDFALKTRVNGSHWPEPHVVWQIIGEEAKKLGLTWGGDWKTIKDKPHVEVKITLADLREQHDKGGRERVWTTIAGLLQPNKKDQDKAA